MTSIVMLCFAFLVLISAQFASVSAAESVVWERFDVTLDLRGDGSYHITERQVIRFEGGTFSGGFATLPLDRIDSIENISLSEESNGNVRVYEFVPWSRYDEEPRTFSYRETSSEIEINWGFPQTRNESRTFLLEYDVIGALRVYGSGPDALQQIWWTAVTADVTETALVETSTVTINLPEPIDPSTALLGEDAEEIAADHTTDGQVWTWTKTFLDSGDEFVVRLEFPALVNATQPSWQQEDDTRRLEEEKSADRQSLYDLIFIGIGFLFSVVGIAGVYGLWYTRGRDPHVGLVAEFLPAPPDDLPPGAVGSLLDEVAHERDIVATIVDFGHRGIIKIDEQSGTPGAGLFGGRDFALTLLDASRATTEFEQSVLTSLFGGGKESGYSVQLSRARASFASSAEHIKDQMYEELIKRGYFAQSPEHTRSRWRTGAIVLLASLLLLTCLTGGIVSDISWFIYFPAGIVAIVLFAIIFLSRVLPKKTVAGAEAAAKWRAFQKYLTDIEKYDKLSESQQIFDRYLPYAVAFGLEGSWVRKFSSVGATPPAWYGPVIVSGPRDWSQRPQTHRPYGGGTIWTAPGGGGAGRSTGGGEFGIPGMQEMSDSAGKSIQGSSDSFFDMLSSASRAFGDFSSSGGSSRRHWGGSRRSGGGFSGGGRRGGSSGGGKRGFR